MRKFWYGPGGALVTDEPIDGVTQELMTEMDRNFYGARWFVCETLTWEAAVKVAELLGGKVAEK